MLVIPVMTAGLPLQGQLAHPRPDSAKSPSPARRGPVPSYPKRVTPSGYPQEAAAQQKGYRPASLKEAPSSRTPRAGDRQTADARVAEFKPPSSERNGSQPLDGENSPPVKFRYQRPTTSGNNRSAANRPPQSPPSRERPQRIDFQSSTLDTSRSINSGFRPSVEESRIRPVSASGHDFRRPIRRTGEAVEDSEDLIEIPMNNGRSDDSFQYHERNGKITLVARQAPIAGILGLIAQQHGLNIVTSDDVNCNVTVTLNDVSLDDALSAILNVNGFAWVQQKDILLISRISGDAQLSPMVQGRQVAVFPLNFVSALDVEKVVTGLLSPVGQSFISQTDPKQKLQSREQIIVEDLPEYVSRIEQCICQMDQPPRQVLIEAHVLQVSLKNENRNGVNFENLLRIANADVTLKTTGFANPNASPAFFLGVDGTDLDVLIEALQTTTDAKTLASPQVLVINGQEARIQIGAQLGYLVTTTTQTSTLQQVNFLDLGVVLNVIPQISADNRVLLTVKPEVSSGRINPDTGLPEEDTTEVQTTIMLNNGQGMIIGGLIKETDSDIQSKIPLIGDLWGVGRLFQRRTTIRERNEIIIALVPRIVPYDPETFVVEESRLIEASTPLMDKKLTPNDRPWEGRLPDAMNDPRRLDARRLPHAARNLTEDYPHPPRYYFPSVIEKQEEYERYREETALPEYIEDEYIEVPAVDGAAANRGALDEAAAKSGKIRPLFRRR